MKKLILLVITILLVGCSNDRLLEQEKKVQILLEQVHALEDENNELKNLILELDDLLESNREALVNQARRDALHLQQMGALERSYNTIFDFKEDIEELERKISYFSEYEVKVGYIKSIDPLERLVTFELVNLIKEGKVIDLSVTPFEGDYEIVSTYTDTFLYTYNTKVPFTEYEFYNQEAYLDTMIDQLVKFVIIGNEIVTVDSLNEKVEE